MAIIKILSISVVSPTRDHTTQVELLGQLCEISRKGTNADLKKAIQMYKDLDGKVDAFGVGGSEFYLQVAEKKYYFRDITQIRKAIKISKVGDGNSIKGILAERALIALEEHLNKEGKTLKGLKGLKTNAVDRYQMAEAMVNAGIDTTFGDFYFALGIPVKVKSLAAVRVL
ncbi:MAG: quinate 5-dehydrogenase, partial [Chloroflexota bacterium]